MEAILFDLDETLLTEKPLVAFFLPQIYEKIAKKLGIDRESARIRFLREVMSRKNTYEWHDWNFFFRLFNLDLRYEELLTAYPHKIRVFPDVIPTLEWLKEEGYRLGIITSGPKYQRLKLRIAKLDNYFDVIVTRDDLKTVKPDPKIFLYALEKLKVEPDEAMMIGDSLEQDVYGAKSVGMVTVWINRSNDKGYNFADYEIRTLHELRKILEGLE
ncbi:MAG TPA: TIGR02253 family HAD-type hydrolase [Thermococcus paralvinellae]|uniref:Glyceraldehyde 3-phosphate phosphatase n=1 Tax=Thermococcus paralvinellae TaxID=582419 RepID=A0A832ZEY7_9EURY|nr:TIGR02253 family HAD-type hydrolase [Thermococcus paralvinellae]